MSESLPTSDPGTQKRRSTRVVQAVPISVSGVDALGQPFKERTTTVMVNCHGCKYQSKHYVPKNSVVTLEIPRMEPAFPPRIVPGHVVWVQRPRTVRELFQIGLEFEVPGNVWGIAFPPEDWVPCADEPIAAGAVSAEEMDIDVVVEKEIAEENKATAPMAVATEKKGPEAIPPPVARPPMHPAAAPAGLAENPPSGSMPPTTVIGDAKIHVMPSPTAPAPTVDAQLAVARQMAKIVAEAKETLDKTLRRGAQTAITEEMAIVRQQLDAQMHETIEHAIKASIERVSEAEVKKVIHQAANKTAAIVEEARLASEANVAQIDAKLRQAVQQAVSQATEQAASHAAKQAATITEEARRAAEANLQHVEERTRKAAQEAATEAVKQAFQQRVTQDLNHSVEEVVGRVIAEREATVPSLHVLASPEASQAHVEEWKKNLEQTAQDVRIQMIERSQAEADATSRRWREGFEAMLAGSSAKLEKKLSEASQEALASTEKDFAERKTGLRSFLDEVTSGAEASLRSLGVGLAEERVNAERARVQLEETARATIEQTRRQLDEMMSAQQQTIGQRADEVTSGAEASLRSLGVGLAEERVNAERARAQLEETARATIEQTRQQLDEMIAAQQQAIGRRINEVTSSAEASIQWLGTSLAQERANAERAKEQLQEAAKTTIEQTRRQIDEMVAAKHEAIGQRTESLIAEGVERIDPILNNAAQKVIEHFGGELDQKLAPKLDEAQRAISEITTAGQRAADLQTSLDQQIQQAARQAAQIQDSIQSHLHELSDAAVQKAAADLANAQQEAARLQNQLREQARQVSEEIAQVKSGALEYVQQGSNEAVQQALSKLGDAMQQVERLQGAIRGEVEQASGQVALIQHAARERVQRESEATVEKAVGELAFAGQEVVRLQDTIREQTLRASELATEAARAACETIQLAAHDVVQRAVSELAEAAGQTAQLQNSIREGLQWAEAQTGEIHNKAREQAREASEQAVHESLERMRQEAAKFPAELELTCRATITKLEEELDQKSSEMQHSAYEALLKSAEWYQKKAQTHMQSTMERVIEQSSNAMTEKAGEVSSLVAAELDHYQRSYVDHARSEIDEVAKEVLDRERLRLNEAAEIANATFTDRVQHVTHESLRRFQETSREALEKARADMNLRGESSLEDFVTKLDEKMTLGVEQAATYLQSQLMPLLESWEAKRQAEKQEWMEQVKNSAEESIESYKARLENTTNGWLLASAATLGQNSQAVLDSLSKNAEKRLRETCSRVLVSMGDVLKDRLMGISTAFSAEEPDDNKK